MSLWVTEEKKTNTEEEDREGFGKQMEWTIK